MFVYVGCYTTPDRAGTGEGIAVYRMDDRSGRWTHVQRLAGIANPSFLALDPSRRFLYCVHGGNDFSAVSAFAVEQGTGRLTFLNTQQSGGRNPVSLDVHPTGRALVVANYRDGTVATLPINSDGTLAPLTTVLTQTGALGPDPVEQAGSHPHHSPFDPAGRFVAVPDKGLDRTFVYRFDAERGTLAPNDPPFVQARAGAGPRHIAFHPDAPYAYVINELDATITTYGYDAERGMLDPRQRIGTLPPAYIGRSTGAEIAIAPSGRFLYASNRGHDSIAIFAIDAESGALTAVGWAPTQGTMPRFFALDPAGQFLSVANQGSDTIVAFRVDRTTGMLNPTGDIVQTGSPVCIVFADDTETSTR
ncbi:MAG: lactonase family protein [Chloroflexota bacterium]|nr:lactonase family protein [Chloroflexota bacterium]